MVQCVVALNVTRFGASVNEHNGGVRCANNWMMRERERQRQKEKEKEKERKRKQKEEKKEAKRLQAELDAAKKEAA